MRVLFNRLDVRVSIGYGIIATLWILFSDSAVALVFSGNPALWQAVSSLKGLGFVLVTALGLFILLSRELRKRDRIEGELRESEQRFRKIADTAPAMLWITDVTGQTTFVNRGWYEFTGQSERNALDWDWLDVVHPDDRETGKRQVLSALETQNSFQFEFRLRQQSSGEYRWCISTGTPRYTDNGTLLGYVGTTIDITEHRAAKQNMQDADLLRRELEQEKELLQLKERFISVVSHEFRTPLSVIMSSTELVYRFHDRMPLERQLKHLGDVLAQAEFMVGLLDDVLTVNKSSAGRLEFDPTPVDVAAFAQTMLERMQTLDKGTHSFVLAADGLPQASLDAKLLQHILLNLLSNAAKYSPAGTEVSLNVRQENENIVFQVRDHGIGIPAASLQRISEPFFRAGNAREVGGTGLGMTIVKDSVSLHQGTLHIESEEHLGTTVTVSLPLAPPPPAAK